MDGVYVMSGNEKPLPSIASLQESLRRLEIAAEKVIQTRGYTDEVKSLKILAEIIREQLTHAHPGPPTRSFR